MARQVLHLTAPGSRAQEIYRLASSQRNVQALTGILKTLGEAEQKRRERETLDRITRAIGEGKTNIEAIKAITDAAAQPPSFGTGFRGILQRLGGGLMPQTDGIGQNIQQMIIGEKLKQALAPKIQQPELPSGFEPTGVTVGPKGGVTQRFAPKVVKEPKIRTSKDVMTDINRVATGLKKATDIGDKTLKANIERDLDNLHNELIQVRQRDFPEVIGPEHYELFDKVIEGQPKENRWGRWIFSDKVYGSKAYQAAKRAYIKEAIRQYKTSPKSATQQFDRIWLEKYQAEAGERFQKFGEPSTFGQAKGAREMPKLPFANTAKAQSAPDMRLDQYWNQLSTKQKEDIWTQFEADPTSIDRILEMIKSATP